MKQYVKWGFLAIGTYLVLDHWGGSKAVLGSGSSAGSTIIKAFQGR